MQDVQVQFWIGDQDDVISYTVAVEDGIVDTEAAIEKARTLAQDDGHRDINVKEISPL